jgi:DNA primase catalytic core
MIDDSKLTNLLDRISLLDLIERETRVKLKKAGSEFRGCCPIHQGDNNTAFSIFQNGAGGRWLWHCYTGCNAGGDALTFIRKLHNLDFVEAVKWLCDYERMPFESLGLTEQAIAEHKEREQRRDVLELAARFYRSQFEANQDAQQYALSRGFTIDTVRTAGFGFSDSQRLAAWLKDKNADLSMARQIGLLRADGLDFTANANGQAASPNGWLIYVHRVVGRVDYLSARALHPADPKDKSRNLPGSKHIYRAEVRGDGGLIVVEGQADAESWRQLGHSAWALCGTSLNDADAAAIRARKPVMLMLDNDNPGQARTTDVARAIGPLVMISPPLPDEHSDMNQWLQAGATADAANALLTLARPFIDMCIEDSAGVPAYEMDECAGKIAALIGMLPETLQGRYLKRASATLTMPIADLKQRMKYNSANGKLDYRHSEIRNGCLYFRGDALANFAARITHQLTIDDGSNAPTVRYNLQAKLADGRNLGPVEIDAEEFEKVNAWVPRHWGADAIVYVGPAQFYQISRAIKELSRDSMQRETVYTFTGWTTIAGRRSYLTASGAIHAGGLDPNVRVDLGQNRLGLYKLPAPPAEPETLRKAVKLSLGFLHLAPKRITVPIWAAMYGAPLLNTFSMNAVIWIYGPTQSGKSTLVMLALAHFGDSFIRTRDYSAPIDWMSTVTAIEHAMFATKDLPLVVDDFAPQFTTIGESRDMHRKAHQVIRSVGNRASRGRANADLSERLQRPPRGIVLGTAELPLAGQSIVGRMIYVPVERGDVPFTDEPGSLDWAQEAAGPGHGMYAIAMAGYVQWLAANWDQAIAEARADHERAVQYARPIFPSTQSRLIDYYAALYTYSRAGLRFAAAVGAEHPEVLRELSEEIVPVALVELLRNQSARVAGQSPVVRLLEAVADLLLSKRAYLAPRIGLISTPAPEAALIGWYGHDEPSNSDVIYLRLAPCLQLAREYWQRAGENLDSTTDALQREIWQSGLLTRRDVSDYTISVWIGSERKTVRCLALDRTRVVAMVDMDLWPGGDESA